jgi:hypothetical protein
VVDAMRLGRAEASLSRVTQLSHQCVKQLESITRIRRQWSLKSLPKWDTRSESRYAAGSPGRRARLRAFSVAVSIAIAVVALFALNHALSNVDYAKVFAAVGRINGNLIALAILLVAVSYGSLTLYDLLALRTIGRADVPFRIAALASFTSYPIAHGVGAVALVSPIIRYRIYSGSGLGVVEVANICFLTGLTFWLGNLTALGLSALYEPDAIGLIDYLPLQVNRWLAVALLLGVFSFLVWSWPSPRRLGTKRWAVRLPSGGMVLLQVVIGIIDLGAAALAMFVLIPAGLNIDVYHVIPVFIAAMLLGFASHAPAGLGVFDATILIGLGGEEKEPLIAALLLFRFLYHLVPFVLALGLFGAVEGWRSLRRNRRGSSHRRTKLEPDHSHDDQRKTHDSNGVGRFAENHHANDDTANGANPGPHGISSAERQ